LVTWDWGEAFVALNLILKPMIDELFMKHAADLALGQNDHLLGQVLYSLNEDCQWHRDWSRALVQMLMADSPSNLEIIQRWVKLWRPKATEAIAALANLFEANAGNQGNPVYQRLSRQIDEFGTEFLQGMALEKF
jgi:toluene monooxygenase system protein E